MTTRTTLRWISVLLCLALLVSLTTAAFAGAPARREPEIPDAVWLYGIPVDNEDYYDPTHGGRFNYDAETNTLSILKNCPTDGQLVIYSSRPGLTIYVANDVTVGGDANHAISLEADTTITGPGKLTLVTESGTEEGYSGIVLNSGAALTLEDCTLDVSGDHGIYAWDGDASLKIIHSQVHAKGTASAISNIKGGIWLIDCQITEPVDGFVDNDKVAYKDGSVALETLIIPGEPTVLYTVRFEPNGHGRLVSTMVEKGQPVERPGDPFEEGWTFLGWYREPECVTPYNFVAPVTGDLTLYAKWRIARSNVSFDAGNGEDPVVVSVANNTAVAAPQDPTREGYTFAGWTGTALDGPAVEVTIAAGSTGNRTYTATWTPIIYDITYTLNGGTVASNKWGVTVFDTATLTVNDGASITAANDAAISSAAIDCTFASRLTV